MISKISRRLGLKLVAFASLLGFGSGRRAIAQESTGEDLERIDNWDKTHDRVWLGGNFWANPMEDWQIVDGWAECQTTGLSRSVHSLTHQITNPKGSFQMTVRAGQAGEIKKDNGGGFRIGVKSELNEHKSNCFAKSGINAGVLGQQLLLGSKKAKLDDAVDPKDFSVTLLGMPKGDRYELTLTVGKTQLKADFPAENLLGNVAVVSQFGLSPKRGGGRPEGKAYRFTDWRAGGDAFTVSAEHRFGPILWSQYSLSDSRGDEGFVMKMSGLTGPLGSGDNQTVALEIQPKGKKWEVAGEAKLDTDAWVATFRIPNWDETYETPYRLVYHEKHTDGTATRDEWAGVIKANPVGRPLRLGALTCQNDYGFPYAPVAENIVKLDPDMLYFSGDQIYESHGGFGIIRDPAGPAILNYLRKFYQHGWAFRESIRNAPTICLPDDHDVFQGNIWGEGGASMEVGDSGASSKGGYREPARMVNAVHRTCTAHHPDFFDAKPSKQDISVYFGDMVYGGVSFAILGDRQWKSGPERVDTGSGRADHVPNQDFDTSVLDKPGLILLGERQEEFLKQWGEDWRGHTMKVLLSQTVFAGVATHHGGANGYLKADLDSGGWPQTARNNAIDIIRKSKALHINGDQHLTTLTQYGVENQRDSNWSFCTPAISAGYPRWWRPDDMGMEHENRPKHGNDNTGEFLDGLGNKAYVYAVGNPVVGTDKNRYNKAHQKGSGFGLVVIDTEKLTYRLNSFRFLVDPTDGKPENQFPGWPVTIHQKENAGENVLG